MGLMRKEYHRHSKRVTSTRQWQVLRHAVLERDGWKCRGCGKRGRLEIDHVKPVRTDPALAFDPANCQALCPSCHTAKTRIECGHKPASDDRLKWRDSVLTLERQGKDEPSSNEEKPCLNL
jgi:5-methylcytosine-specific restriction endonuclease McrA